MILYRNFSSKKAIDLEYNATLKVEDFQLYLAPLSFSWLQPSIKLTPEVIVNRSPISQIPSYSPPMLVAVGGDETLEFNRQSEDYV